MVVCYYVCYSMLSCSLYCFMLFSLSIIILENIFIYKCIILVIFVGFVVVMLLYSFYFNMAQPQAIPLYCVLYNQNLSEYFYSF